MTIQDEIKAAGLPEHIAIIMDGNGRWAQQRGLDRVYGHKAGVDTVKRVVEAAGEIGLHYLTLYTFSLENWNRPKTEVDALMGLMADAIVRETPELMKQGGIYADFVCSRSSAESWRIAGRKSREVKAEI